MRSVVHTVVSLLSVLAIACGGDGINGGDGDGDGDGDVEPLPDAGPNDFIVGGVLFGEGRRAGDFNVLFTNTDGLGSLHAYGLGRSVDGVGWSLALPSSLPMEAQVGGTVAVGHLIMTEVDDSIEAGQTDNSASGKVIGVSREHMVFYRSAPFVTQFAWEEDFPSEGGWFCGICQRGAQGQPDQLSPVACQSLIVDMGNFQSVSVCNPFR